MGLDGWFSSFFKLTEPTDAHDKISKWTLGYTEKRGIKIISNHTKLPFLFLKTGSISAISYGSIFVFCTNYQFKKQSIMSYLNINH